MDPALNNNRISNLNLQLGHVAPFSQGHGMLQVKDAFDHVVKHGEYQYLDVDYVVNVPSLGAGAQGIYLRESFHTNRPQEVSGMERLHLGLLPCTSMHQGAR